MALVKKNPISATGAHVNYKGYGAADGSEYTGNTGASGGYGVWFDPTFGSLHPTYHFSRIDLRGVKKVSRLHVQNRTDSYTDGRLRRGQILYSQDGVVWTPVGGPDYVNNDFTTAVNTANSSWWDWDFPEVTARYLEIRCYASNTAAQNVVLNSIEWYGEPDATLARPRGAVIDPNYHNIYDTNMANNLAGLYLCNNGVYDVNIVNGYRAEAINPSTSPYFFPWTDGGFIRGFNSGTSLAASPWIQSTDPNRFSLLHNSFTLVARIRTTSGGNIRGVVGLNDPTPGSKGMALYVNTNGSVTVRIAGTTYTTAAGLVVDGQWAQVAVTRDYSVVNGYYLNVYVDGNMTTFNNTVAPVWATGSLYLMACPITSGTTYGMYGDLAYVAWYEDRCLNGADICTLDNGLPIMGGDSSPLTGSYGNDATLYATYRRTFYAPQVAPLSTHPEYVECATPRVQPLATLYRGLEAPTDEGETTPSGNTTGMGQIFPVGRQ